jgi:hypothetical protein
MSQQQMLALAGLAAAVLYAYWPTIQKLIPNAQPKSQLLADLEIVVRLQKTYNSEEVNAACKALLEALLGLRK